MQITFNKQTALAITRKLRTARTAPRSWGKRVDLVDPDPAPRIRWTRKLIEQSACCDLVANAGNMPAEIDIAVTREESRLEMRTACNTIYGPSCSLPPRSFIEVQPGIAISCPELLFIEMATELDPASHLMLGHELCGGFSRDAADPRNGDVTFPCPPVTTRSKIASYLGKTRRIAGAKQARRTLEILTDNAWSPTESIIAAMASLPFGEYGYDLGSCELNVRIDTPGKLVRATSKTSRVPDILFAGTPVGINYDGAVHLDLDSIVKAAIELERNPGQAQNQQALDAVVREVRRKAVDDIRRNRELAADGLVVFPVTKEDLYEEGGLDRVMLQVIAAIENSTGADMSRHAQLLDVELGKKRRQELIWSLLPETRTPRAVTQPEKRKAASASASAKQRQITEILVGF